MCISVLLQIVLIQNPLVYIRNIYYKKQTNVRHT